MNRVPPPLPPPQRLRSTGLPVSDDPLKVKRFTLLRTQQELAANPPAGMEQHAIFRGQVKYIKYVSIHLHMHLPSYVSIHISIYLSICLSANIYMYIYLSIYLSIHLSIYLHSSRSWRPTLLPAWSSTPSSEAR